MAGMHLSELLAACIALKGDIDDALETASLSPLVSMHGRPVNSTKRLKPPMVTVGFEGPRARDLVTAQSGTGGSRETHDEVTVEFELDIDGTEADCAAYEGVVDSVLRNAGATLADAVTDGTLTRWWPVGAETGPDDDVRNRKAWQVTMRYSAWIVW